MSNELIPLILIFFLCIMALIWCTYSLFDLRRMRKQMDEAHEKWMEVLEAELKRLKEGGAVGK